MSELIKINVKIVILFCVLLVQNSNIYATQNKILFKINNEIITSIDIFSEIEYLKLINPKIKNLSKEKLFEISKNSLIREKIRKIEILKNFSSTDVEEKYLQLLLDDFADKTKLKSKEALQKELESKGLNITTILEKLKIEILWNQLILNKFSSKVKIDRKKIKKEIISNNIQQNYLLSEIVFNLDKETVDDKYNLIKKEISRNGFESAAIIHSISQTSKQGGKLGWIKLNSLNKKIKEEILKTKINQITKPITIPGGFLILRIENKKNIKVINDIDEEVEKVSRSHISKQLNQFSNIYLSKIKKEILINEL